MNDPHVVALIYRINHSDLVDYKKASPLIVESPGFRVTLDGGKARAEMLEHFATEQGARGAVEPFLREWELAADLKYPRDRFRFVYQRPEVIDRSPVEEQRIIEGHRIIKVVGDKLRISAADVAHLGRDSWPEPPADLAMSPDVKALHTRWLDHLDGKERLLSAAYWALTMIEAAPGPPAPSSGPRMTKRRAAASTFFNIEPDVLKTLGHLTSARGGVEEGRKAEGALAPLSDKERTWLKAAFKALVERAALQAYYQAYKVQPPVPLTMKDLPNLTP